MKQMEEELNKLRQQVDTSEQLKGHSPQSRPQPPSTAAHARTVPSAGGGKRTRVAHQPNPKGRYEGKAFRMSELGREGGNNYKVGRGGGGNAWTSKVS